MSKARVPNPGEHLRALRERRGLTMRDVHNSSLEIAKELGEPAFAIPPSRLHDIETKKIVPSIHRLYTPRSTIQVRLPVGPLVIRHPVSIPVIVLRCVCPQAVCSNPVRSTLNGAGGTIPLPERLTEPLLCSLWYKKSGGDALGRVRTAVPVAVSVRYPCQT